MSNERIEDAVMRRIETDEIFRANLRRHLLTQELLDVPTRMGRLESLVEAMVGRMDQIDKRIEQVDSRMDQTGRRMDQMDRRLDQMDRRLDRMENDIGDLKGLSLENKIYFRFGAYISRYFDLWEVERMRVEASAEFNGKIRDGLRSGVLSRPEYDRLRVTDTICVGQDEDDATVYVAVEASYGISHADVNKVCQSRRLIKRLYPEAESRAGLYFMARNEEVEREARDRGVTLIVASTIR